MKASLKTLRRLEEKWLNRFEYEVLGKYRPKIIRMINRKLTVLEILIEKEYNFRKSINPDFARYEYGEYV